ncbi:unnamed protein product [Amoebophrya sp. A25]|nr:unnamed protein product [Amoebophrya sp. A25]|eukprot:GSA25T00013731001.1
MTEPGVPSPTSFDDYIAELRKTAEKASIRVIDPRFPIARYVQVLAQLENGIKVHYAEGFLPETYVKALQYMQLYKLLKDVLQVSTSFSSSGAAASSRTSFTGAGITDLQDGNSASSSSFWWSQEKNAKEEQHAAGVAEAKKALRERAMAVLEIAENAKQGLHTHYLTEDASSTEESGVREEPEENHDVVTVSATVAPGVATATERDDEVNITGTAPPGPQATHGTEEEAPEVANQDHVSRLTKSEDEKQEEEAADKAKDGVVATAGGHEYVNSGFTKSTADRDSDSLTGQEAEVGAKRKHPADKSSAEEDPVASRETGGGGESSSDKGHVHDSSPPSCSSPSSSAVETSNSAAAGNDLDDLIARKYQLLRPEQPPQQMQTSTSSVFSNSSHVAENDDTTLAAMTSSAPNTSSSSSMSEASRRSSEPKFGAPMRLEDLFMSAPDPEPTTLPKEDVKDPVVGVSDQYTMKKQEQEEQVGQDNFIASDVRPHVDLQTGGSSTTCTVEEDGSKIATRAVDYANIDTFDEDEEEDLEALSLISQSLINAARERFVDDDGAACAVVTGVATAGGPDGSLTSTLSSSTPLSTQEEEGNRNGAISLDVASRSAGLQQQERIAPGAPDEISSSSTAATVMAMVPDTEPTAPPADPVGQSFFWPSIVEEGKYQSSDPRSPNFCDCYFGGAGVQPFIIPGQPLVPKPVCEEVPEGSNGSLSTFRNAAALGGQAGDGSVQVQGTAPDDVALVGDATYPNIASTVAVDAYRAPTVVSFASLWEGLELPTVSHGAVNDGGDDDSPDSVGKDESASTTAVTMSGLSTPSGSGAPVTEGTGANNAPSSLSPTLSSSTILGNESRVDSHPISSSLSDFTATGLVYSNLLSSLSAVTMPPLQNFAIETTPATSSTTAIPTYSTPSYSSTGTSATHLPAATPKTSAVTYSQLQDFAPASRAAPQQRNAASLYTFSSNPIPTTATPTIFSNASFTTTPSGTSTAPVNYPDLNMSISTSTSSSSSTYAGSSRTIANKATTKTLPALGGSSFGGASSSTAPTMSYPSFESPRLQQHAQKMISMQDALTTDRMSEINATAGGSDAKAVQQLPSSTSSQLKNFALPSYAVNNGQGTGRGSYPILGFEEGSRVADASRTRNDQELSLSSVRPEQATKTQLQKPLFPSFDVNMPAAQGTTVGRSAILAPSATTPNNQQASPRGLPAVKGRKSVSFSPAPPEIRLYETSNPMRPTPSQSSHLKAKNNDVPNNSTRGNNRPGRAGALVHPTSDNMISSKPSALAPRQKSMLVDIPFDLVRNFAALVAGNTRKNVETCGWLCGRKILAENKVYIDYILLPPQKGDDVSCEATDEMPVFEWQMSKKNCLTFGWIHTHPRHNTFLSAVDLHQQCSFQLQEPLSVAIVYSPIDTHKKAGIFRLTDYGVDFIQQCPLTGFHPHDKAKQPLYDTAKGIVVNKRRNIKVVDFRKDPKGRIIPFNNT